MTKFLISILLIVVSFGDFLEYDEINTLNELAYALGSDITAVGGLILLSIWIDGLFEK